MCPLTNSPTVLGGLFALLCLGCGGGSGVEPRPRATTIALHAGDNQSAPLKARVSIAPSVKVTDANVNPVSGVAVVFEVTSGGGSVVEPNQTTNESGIATVGSWKLGPGANITNTLTATAAGLDGSPVTFTATSRRGRL